ncbi:MAG TPA: PKD domain-containing protein, partial [Candidatus Thermoplasmatota archaeon]|nr:PKD domain-containing protein [Candidatus Thermoplasmatota archaeon]
MSSRHIAVAVALIMLVPIALPLVPTAAAAPTTPPPGAPTFANFRNTLTNPSQSEPTIGINHQTGTVWFMENTIAWAVTMDLNANPPTANWQRRSPPNSIYNIDPMMFTDLGTGRTFAGGLDGECSIMSYTDDDGKTWTPTGNQCAGAFDHQTIGAGPWKEPRPAQAIHDRATYYCAQGWLNWPANACVVSYDGGLVYSPPVNWQGPCFGLHGHVNVSRDGTAYVPTRNCNGKVGFARTDDNGASWRSYQTGITSPGTGFDPSIATSKNNRVWMAAEDPTWLPVAAYSDDKGTTWSQWKNVGADAGIKTATFMKVLSGDPERAAVAYLGSTTDGNPFASNWPGVWYLYVSYTYDGGQTWTTVLGDPEPVQRGWMCAAGAFCGSGRNLLDFMGATLDPKGMVLVGYADGCIGACNLPSGTPSQSTRAVSTIARQLGGRGLYAEHDTASVDITGILAGVAGSPVTLTASIGAASPYTATVSWGDGVVESLSGLAGSAFTRQHTYASGGTYTVTLSVVGSDGAAASDSTQATISGGGGGDGVVRIASPADGATVESDIIVVQGIVEYAGNTAPVAAYSHTVSGLTLSVNGGASTDADGDALAYQWSFGDGSPLVGGVTASRTYAAPGTYNVCLTVTDGIDSDELCKSITLSSSGMTQIVTDPEGDAPNPLLGTQIADMDIVRVRATKTAAGEPVLELQVKTLASITQHLEQGMAGAVWSVHWQGPTPTQRDMVQLTAGFTGYSCTYGYIEDNFAWSQSAAPCTVTPGTPGRITFTYPLAAMAAHGYQGNEVLTDIQGETIAFYGVGELETGATSTVDSTLGGNYALNVANLPVKKIGTGPRSAKPAPSSPPADPEITDKVVDPFEATLPHLNIQSAWFDSDATNLYVGLKVQDIPADASTTAFVTYAVTFQPGWTVSDPTWSGRMTGTFTGLRVSALYSPVTAAGGPPRADNATRFSLQVLYTQTGNNFAEITTLQGSVDPASDIVWWVVPRTALQDPPGNSKISTPSAASGAAVGGIASYTGWDTTGTGKDYTFPGSVVTPPTVSLVATPTSGVAPLSVIFSASATPANVATWSIDYGDGESASGTGSIPGSFSHVYATTGTFLAVLTATNADGTGTGQASITVGDTPPPATSVLVQATGLAPVVATCDAACATWTAAIDVSSLPAGAFTLSATLLSHGDAKSVDSISLVRVSSSGILIDSPVAGQTYDFDVGSIAVTGTLAGSDDPPRAALSADRAEGVVPLTVTFHLGGHDDKGIVGWTLDTGEGGTLRTGTSIPASVTHTFHTPGTYAVTLTVQDGGGK